MAEPDTAPSPEERDVCAWGLRDARARHPGLQPASRWRAPSSWVLGARRQHPWRGRSDSPQAAPPPSLARRRLSEGDFFWLTSSQLAGAGCCTVYLVPVGLTVTAPLHQQGCGAAEHLPAEQGWRRATRQPLWHPSLPAEPQKPDVSFPSRPLAVAPLSKGEFGVRGGRGGQRGPPCCTGVRAGGWQGPTQQGRAGGQCRGWGRVCR